MISPELIAQATKARPTKARVDEDALRALTAYYGGEELEPYIIAYSAHENADKLKERRRKTVSHYKNFVQRINAQYVEGVFGSGVVERASSHPAFTAWLGTLYHDWFLAEVAGMALLLPELYVRVRRRTAEEKGVSSEAVTTRAHEQALGLFPEPCVIYPQHVLNFCQGETGELEWVSIVHPDRRAGKDGGTVVEIITATERMVVTADKGETIEVAEPHNFGRCPVVRIVYAENHALGGNTGHAMMSDVIRLALATLNVDAMLVEAAVQHLSPKLITDGETAAGIVANGIGASNVVVEKGVGVNKTLGHTRYLQMSEFELTLLKTWGFDDLPALIMEAARLRDRGTVQHTSGVSKLMDAVPEIAAIKAVGKHFQRYDQRISSLLAAAYGEKVTATVVYPSYDETAAAVVGESAEETPTTEKPPTKRGGFREPAQPEGAE
jgi:hypothetical protein